MLTLVRPAPASAVVMDPADVSVETMRPRVHLAPLSASVPRRFVISPM
ncbi:hypothetical protein N7925_35905 [Streptomyces sp. CA-278952]|nr:MULTISPECIES: hypothetical protein [unclassified Streptomyces]UZI33440.1 hypothetical protein OH133_38160 [Streptomyces sp. VB1]WDG33328.1 hypothetical protein N7925_35905 [Streptomyces sp. CA-278952]